ncbi:DUF4147 domain-containing protein [Enterobacter mori]|uniref:DUF4147 domain-containing protein n=1 Tax=Enterobacter mori TaxID=539813 RepID=UPI001FD33A56|nr:DUF4147 domain-containing protein [Enterobacter mori]
MKPHIRLSDAMSEMASMLMMEQVKGLREEDCVIALISPVRIIAAGFAKTRDHLAVKQAVNKALLKAVPPSMNEIPFVSSYPISRRGWRWPRVLRECDLNHAATCLGDDPQSIASGPTVADSSTPAQALEIVRRYGITLPEHIIKVLETPRLPVTASDIEQDIRTIATPSGALAAAASVASKMGFTPLILGDAIEGESAQLGIVMAGIANL